MAKGPAPTTTQAQDAAAAEPKLTAAERRLLEVKRRLDVLNNLNVRAPVRAAFAGVRPNELPAYLQGLKDLGLIDAGERLTPTGAAYCHIAEQQGENVERLDKRALWRLVGGDEPRLDGVIASLVESGLITEKKGRFEVAV